MSLSRRAMLLAMLGGVALFITWGCDKEEEPRPSFLETLAARPEPDLEVLAKKVAEKRIGSEGFDDIIKLRESREPKAVPVLERILSDHIDAGDTFGFAAAQALFCINSPEAHGVLSNHLLSARYNAKLGINYAYHWEMDASKRAVFIERYHLQNLSNDLQLTLAVEPVAGEKNRTVLFRLTAKNTSEKPFHVVDEKVYLGSHLHFRSESGSFVRASTTAKYEVQLAWVEMKPGESLQYEVKLGVRRVQDLGYRWPFLSKDSTLVLTTRDMAIDIGRPGRFKVVAMMEAQPPTKFIRDYQLENFGFDNPWSGRAVSNSVEIDIRSP